MTGRAPLRRASAVIGGVLAAGVLGLLLESGIARRIGFDLLLPVQDGVFLAGRMARLAALLVLCLAGCCTARGRALADRLRAWLARDRFCWLASALITALFFLWAWRVTVWLFMTNDDTSIMKAVGAIPAYGLSAASRFTHIVFSALLGALYRLEPDGYWYAWYHLAVLAVSLTVIGRCLLLKLRRHALPAAAGPALHMALCAGAFLPAVAELSFTVTPAIAGTAAAALILCLDETEGRAGRICAGVGSVVLMLLCCLQRAETGRALLCFWALAVGYQAAKCLFCVRPVPWRRLAALALLAAATLVCRYAVTSLTLEDLAGPTPAPEVREEEVQTEEEPADASSYSYADAEHYRSRVMDYLLEQMTNEELEQVGLPQELSTLLRSWYFMDQRINTDTFKRIVELYDATHTAAQPAPDAGDAAQPAGLAAFAGQLQAALADETAGHLACMRLLTAAVVLLVMLTLLRLLLYGLSGWLETLCALFAAGGAGLMWLRLIQDGRFLLRVFLVPAIPAIVTMLLLAADLPARPQPPRTHRIGAGLSAAVLAGLCVLSAMTAGHVPYVRDSVSRTQVVGTQRATEQYLASRSDISFYTSMTTNDLDPFHSATDYPSNIRRWGGTGVTTSSDRPYADAFFREDVRFLTDNPASTVMLMQYMSLDWGPVQAAVEDRVNGSLYVFRFSRIRPPEEDYTGWYEQNGLTYYFRDGRPLTGAQTVEGERYTFAPAGAESQFSAAPGPDGLVYFTTAYSLVDPAA